jgi:cell division transport system permease protein
LQSRQPHAATTALAGSLEKLAEVDFVRLDTQWTERLNAIVALLTNAALLLTAVLALAVFLVVGNTIRLEIENRRGEIRIMDLVGATPAFIRRPFLYSGAWYGLLGGISAWIMVSLSIYLLQAPVTRLATSTTRSSNSTVSARCRP